MNLTINSLALVACLLGLAVSASAQNRQTTPNGNIVLLHTAKPGPKVQPGGTATISVHTWLRDTMVSSTTRDFGGPREVQVPTKEQMASGQVPAVFEALLMMAEGDSATAIMPLDSNMQKTIPPNFGKVTEIRFEIFVTDVPSPEELAAKEAAAQKMMAEAQAKFGTIETKVQTLVTDYNAGKLMGQIKTLPSGLQMIVHEQGTGEPVKPGEEISAHYYGCLKDGKMFDNSFQRGEPLPFAQGMGQMIPGFDEGAGLLNHGGKATLFLPASLGYGEGGTPDGSIPPNSMLIFYIEVQ